MTRKREVHTKLDREGAVMLFATMAAIAAFYVVMGYVL